jgi:3-oxoacyl-[acyl-carrier-protein] synthase II
MATSAACASSLQAIGTGYEFIRSGRQDVLLCGGAEELHPSVTGSFDVVFATSVKYNQTPQKTPRPFDKERDGLVCGEGSGMIVLEEYEHARERNAKIYAEVSGYSTCGSGIHISQSDKKSIIRCIHEALMRR